MALQDDYRQQFNACQTTLMRNRTGSVKQTLQSLADYAQAELDADVYGSGSIINEFEREVAELLGKEASVFMPSGTMAQPIALRIWCDQARSDFVALPATSHLQLHEHNAYQVLYGLKGVDLGRAHRVPELEDLKHAAADPLAAILLELPMREIGGQLPSWESLVAQSAWAREQGIKMHLDGARLWQCPAAYDRTLAEISGLFDSVYVSFYKDLGGISGAILAGDQSFIDSARIWQRRAGGNLISLYPYVLAAKQGLSEHLPQMKTRLLQTKWLAKELNKVAQCQTWPLEPQTNMFRLRVATNPEEFMARAIGWMEQEGVALIPPGYEIGEAHLMTELSIGNAFGLHDEAFWAQKLESFFAAVFE